MNWAKITMHEAGSNQTNPTMTNLTNILREQRIEAIKRV